VRAVIELEFDTTPTQADVEKYVSALIEDGEIDFTIDPATAPSVDSKNLETYSVVCLSTGHLTAPDVVELKRLACNPGMVLERDYGFFLKLFSADYKDENLSDLYSPELNSIIKWACQRGFQMVEFDQAAGEVAHFPTHDW
jgi:hypothetical protein